MEKKHKTGYYKGVHFDQKRGYGKPWSATKKHKGATKKSFHATEREAAVAYDRMCLDFGLPPVNILKPVKGTANHRAEDDESKNAA